MTIAQSTSKGFKVNHWLLFVLVLFSCNKSPEQETGRLSDQIKKTEHVAQKHFGSDETGEKDRERSCDFVIEKDKVFYRNKELKLAAPIEDWLAVLGDGYRLDEDKIRYTYDHPGFVIWVGKTLDRRLDNLVSGIDFFFRQPSFPKDFPDIGSFYPLHPYMNCIIINGDILDRNTHYTKYTRYKRTYPWRYTSWQFVDDKQIYYSLYIDHANEIWTVNIEVAFTSNYTFDSPVDAGAEPKQVENK